MTTAPPPQNPDANPHDLYGDPNPPHVEMLAARMAALELLGAVLDQRKPLDQALEQTQSFKSLPARDRAFCRMLVTTAIRRLGQVDDLITKAENKPGSRSPVLQNILRLGVTQILFMDVPDHAAVDTAVRMVDAIEMDRQKGFVNGLLRTMTRSGAEWLARQDEGRLNTPEWLLKEWIADYGMGEAAQIASANLSEAPMDISIKNEADRNYWAATFKASEIGCGTLRCPPGGQINDWPGFDDGMWWVQDVSASIPAHLFEDIDSRQVIDLCAAPGGKTMQLAALGAHVTAVDRSANRLKRLEANLKRVRLEDAVEIVVADAADWTPRDPPGFILLDAPCTSTGTIRRHPDILHLKKAEDQARLIDVQQRLLASAFDMLAPRGVLVYCTCSLQKAEGEAQIERLLASRENAVRVPILPEEIGELDEIITQNGDVRILPFHQAALGGMDGFFISRLTKASQSP